MMVDVFRVRIVKIGEKGKEEAPSPTLSIPTSFAQSFGHENRVENGKFCFTTHR